MNEIDRIIEQIPDEFCFTQAELEIIKQCMVKAAMSVIIDSRIAASIISYVEKNV
jgi:hypothetical protein